MANRNVSLPSVRGEILERVHAPLGRLPQIRQAVVSKIGSRSLYGVGGPRARVAVLRGNKRMKALTAKAEVAGGAEAGAASRKELLEEAVRNVGIVEGARVVHAVKDDCAVGRKDENAVNAWSARCG